MITRLLDSARHEEPRDTQGQQHGDVRRTVSPPADRERAKGASHRGQRKDPLGLVPDQKADPDGAQRGGKKTTGHAVDGTCTAGERA